MAVDAGIDVVQLRERDVEAGWLLGVAAEMVEIAAGSTTRIVVNDRLDVALASGAGGVHLRADSIPVEAARRLAPAGFMLGRSVHGADEARSLSDVDYLLAGTVWATRSKPGRQRLLGIDGLAAVVRAVRVPVLAIGGVTLDRIAELARAGAAGCAAIGLFSEAVDGRAGRATSGGRALIELVKTARERFAQAQ